MLARYSVFQLSHGASKAFNFDLRASKLIVIELSFLVVVLVSEGLFDTARVRKVETNRP